MGGIRVFDGEGNGEFRVGEKERHSATAAFHFDIIHDSKTPCNKISLLDRLSKNTKMKKNYQTSRDKVKI